MGQYARYVPSKGIGIELGCKTIKENVMRGAFPGLVENFQRQAIENHPRKAGYGWERGGGILGIRVLLFPFSPGI